MRAFKTPEPTLVQVGLLTYIYEDIRHFQTGERTLGSWRVIELHFGRRSLIFDPVVGRGRRPDIE